jgi:phage terminase small subunit
MGEQKKGPCGTSVPTEKTARSGSVERLKKGPAGHSAGHLKGAFFMSTNNLTLKQERFVQEYLLDMNATQAAIRAGYSPKTVRKNVARLKANEGVQAAIETALAKRSERTEITQDDVLKGLHKEATLTGEDSSHSARVAAWGLIGKHLGMFKEKVEHSGALVQTHVYLPQKVPLDAAKPIG